jgi:5-methylcytosine-specific restriction endonuclease McrA
METKTCSVCGVEKQLVDFPKNGKEINGDTRYRNDCKECYGISRKISKKKHSRYVSNAKFRTGELELLTLKDWKEAMLYFRGACAYCGVKKSRQTRLTKEHIVPVSKGGPTTRTNIIPACTACNCSKADHDLAEWYPKRKVFSVERFDKIKKWQKGVIMK